VDEEHHRRPGLRLRREVGIEAVPLVAGSVGLVGQHAHPVHSGGSEGHRPVHAGDELVHVRKGDVGAGVGGGEDGQEGEEHGPIRPGPGCAGRQVQGPVGGEPPAHRTRATKESCPAFAVERNAAGKLPFKAFPFRTYRVPSKSWMEGPPPIREAGASSA
jgi:hypothetical protein